MGFLTICIDPAEEGVGMSLVTKFVLFSESIEIFWRVNLHKFIYIYVYIFKGYRLMERNYVKSHFLIGKSSCLASISIGL